MRRIEPAHLKKKYIDKGVDFLLLDVRDYQDRNKRNVGGYHLPVGTIVASIRLLAAYKNKPIIVMCKAPGNRAAKQAASILTARHFKDVQVLNGGIYRWRYKYKRETIPSLMEN